MYIQLENGDQSWENITEYVSNNSKLQCLNVSKLEQFGKFFCIKQWLSRLIEVISFSFFSFLFFFYC